MHADCRRFRDAVTNIVEAQSEIEVANFRKTNKQLNIDVLFVSSQRWEITMGRMVSDARQKNDCLCTLEAFWEAKHLYALLHLRYMAVKELDPYFDFLGLSSS